jgi:predicted Fe-Mo cluster-binding NifX family protein
MADAVVNGKALRIEGGNVTIDNSQIPPCGWRQICGQGLKRRSAPQKEDTLATEQGGMMKIAITSADGTLEGMVDERFGRSRKLIIYDREEKNFTVIDNAVNMGAAQGAGIQSAQNVINSGAKAVVSGHLGPNAFRVLQAAGVEVYVASNMTAAQAIQAYEQGKLAKLAGPDVNGHW